MCGVRTSVFAILLAAGLPAVLTGQAARPAAQAALAGNAVRGREVYMKVGCYQCHGREGQGSPTTGPRLGPAPSPLAAFARYTRMPRGEMPPYTEKVLSDQDMADMHAFLEGRPQPPAVRDVFPPEGARRPDGAR